MFDTNVTPRFTLSTTVLDAVDANGRAVFHRRLLGWDVWRHEPGLVKLQSPEGGAGISLQPHDDARFPIDPDGHPFCPFLT
jgi:hypothetical protein